MTEWQYWLGVVLSTGLISAAWTTVWSIVATQLQASRSGKNTALRAAVALERYAIGCWPAVYSGDEHTRQTGTPWFDSVPELTGLPKDEDWKDVDVGLADKVLSFENRISIAQIRAGHSRHFEGNPFDAETESINLGKEAWSLAEQLRDRYGLPAQAAMKKSLSGFLA